MENHSRSLWNFLFPISLVQLEYFFIFFLFIFHFTSSEKRIKMNHESGASESSESLAIVYTRQSPWVETVPGLKRSLSWNRGVPMASRRGQSLLAVFYPMREKKKREWKKWVKVLAGKTAAGISLVHRGKRLIFFIKKNFFFKIDFFLKKENEFFFVVEKSQFSFPKLVRGIVGQRTVVVIALLVLFAEHSLPRTQQDGRDEGRDE